MNDTVFFLNSALVSPECELWACVRCSWHWPAARATTASDRAIAAALPHRLAAAAASAALAASTDSRRLCCRVKRS